MWSFHLRKSFLEPACCKELKKSPNQETGLENRRRLKVLNDTKLILKDGGSPDAPLSLARLRLARLRLNDGAKLGVPSNWCCCSQL